MEPLSILRILSSVYILWVGIYVLVECHVIQVHNQYVQINAQQYCKYFLMWLVTPNVSFWKLCKYPFSSNNSTKSTTKCLRVPTATPVQIRSFNPSDQRHVVTKQPIMTTPRPMYRMKVKQAIYQPQTPMYERFLIRNKKKLPCYLVNHLSTVYLSPNHLSTDLILKI